MYPRASEASNLVDDDTNGTGDVFVYDRQTATFTRITVDHSGVQSNGPADSLAISDDGRHVAFISDAPNLVPDDTNDRATVFVHDRKTGSTTRVSVGDSSGDKPTTTVVASLLIHERSEAPSVVMAATLRSHLLPRTLFRRAPTSPDDVFVHDVEAAPPLG